MRPGSSPINFALFGFLIVLLLVLAQVGVLSIAFSKLGLSDTSAFLLLSVSLAGSLINLPLFTINATPMDPAQVPKTVPAPLRDAIKRRLLEFKGKTLIAVNVGGGLIPVYFSYYLIRNNTIDIFQIVLAVLAVTAVSRLASRPVPGLGITMPIFIAPVAAALTAVVINQEQSAPLAYICGTLGVLIGADLLRLEDIRKMGTPMASIGGAGTFDGIFLTGWVAVLLA